jgi:hypothetical protein
MMKKALFGIVVALGGTHAQSWTDEVGYCKKDFADFDAKKDQDEELYKYFPGKEELAIDSPALHTLLYEVETAEPKKGKQSIRCISFIADDKDKTPSSRFCSVAEGDAPAADKMTPTPIPMWNIKSVASLVDVATK